MTKLNALIKEARQSCQNRGHKMNRFVHVKDVPYLANSHCSVCLRYVGINAKPMPNEIEIGGEAVALNCI